METTARLIADDLFAGAGGWDVAADWLDIHARGVENMPAARATRDAAGLTTVHDDAWTFKPRYTARPEGLHLQAAGLIASPPCQTFSQAGKGSGRKALDDVLQVLPDVATMSLAELRKVGEVFGDDRTALVLTPLWFAIHHPYRWLAWEQVPTVLPVWEACADVLRAHGFSVWTGNLQAEQYGVPQTRKRAFLIASRDLEVAPPTPTHSRYYSRTPDKMDPGVRKWVSMAEALAWGYNTRPSYTITGGSGHAAASGIEWGGKSVREAMIEAAQSGDPEVWASKAVMVSNYGTGGDASKRGTRTLDQPAPTVTSKIDRNRVDLPEWCHKRPATTVVASFCPDVIAAPGYRTTVSRQNALDSVRVTPAEAGVLQSFPADYPWQGAKGKQFLQAGNAVPPLLAMAALSAAIGEPYLPPAQPAGTDTEQPTLDIGASGVVLRNNNTANAAVRPIETPAPTLYFGQRCNYVAWEKAPAAEQETENNGE